MSLVHSILTDVTRCIGCEQCVEACKRANGLPAGEPPPRPRARAGDLSAARWTTVVRRPTNRYVRQQCRHCLEPACVSACPVGALQKTPEGAVVYDKALCLGCRYCLMSCPFGIPRYEWDAVAPSVRKCVLCHDALVSGRLAAPACVTACPTKATIFGPRDEMLAEAARRLAAEPGRYIQRVWGATEAGGTSVLMISDVSLDFLAWGGGRSLGSRPLPERTWAALEHVPIEFVGMGALMGSLYWIIERRQRLARERSGAGGGAAGDSRPGDGHAE